MSEVVCCPIAPFCERFENLVLSNSYDPEIILELIKSHRCFPTKDYQEFKSWIQQEISHSNEYRFYENDDEISLSPRIFHQLEFLCHFYEEQDRNGFRFAFLEKIDYRSQWHCHLGFTKKVFPEKIPCEYLSEFRNRVKDFVRDSNIEKMRATLDYRNSEQTFNVVDNNNFSLYLLEHFFDIFSFSEINQLIQRIISNLLKTNQRYRGLSLKTNKIVVRFCKKHPEFLEHFLIPEFSYFWRDEINKTSDVNFLKHFKVENLTCNYSIQDRTSNDFWKARLSGNEFEYAKKNPIEMFSYFNIFTYEQVCEIYQHLNVKDFIWVISSDANELDHEKLGLKVFSEELRRFFNYNIQYKVAYYQAPRHPSFLNPTLEWTPDEFFTCWPGRIPKNDYFKFLYNSSKNKDYINIYLSQIKNGFLSIHRKIYMNFTRQELEFFFSQIQFEDLKKCSLVFDIIVSHPLLPFEVFNQINFSGKFLSIAPLKYDFCLQTERNKRNLLALLSN